MFKVYVYHFRFVSCIYVLCQASKNIVIHSASMDDSSCRAGAKAARGFASAFLREFCKEAYTLEDVATAFALSLRGRMSE